MSEVNTGRIAAMGMLAREQETAIHAQNIAAKDTIAGRALRPVFHALAFRESKLVGSSTGDSATSTTSGIQMGAGVQLTNAYAVNSQGEPMHTGSPLDVMINGNGFFKVTRSDGTEAYTRAGNFKINGTTGQIVAQNGEVLSPGITIPQGGVVQISENGTVGVLSTDGTISTVGTISLYNFSNPSGLRNVGDGLWELTNDSGQATAGTPSGAGFGGLKAGYLEGSNIDTLTELVSLMTATKGYEMNARSLESWSKMRERDAAINI